MLVSAITGEGIDALDAAIEAQLAAGRVLIELVLDPADGAGVSWLHRHTEVLHKAADEKTGRIGMTVRVDPAKAEAVRARFAACVLPAVRIRSAARQLTAKRRKSTDAIDAQKRASLDATYRVTALYGLFGRYFLRLGLVPERVHFRERCVLRRSCRARPAHARSTENRRSNFRLVCRSNASGSASRWRARLTAANKRSPTSAAALGSSPIERRLDLVGLLADFAQHRARIVPVEADLAALDCSFSARVSAGRATGTPASAPSWAGLPRAALAAFSCALIASHNPLTDSGSRAC